MAVNHLVIDLDGVRPCPFIHDDRERLLSFINTAARAIEMNILYGPVVCEGCSKNPGPTAFAVVDLSHIALHLFTKHNKLRADIYSCKPFRREQVEHLLDIYFPSDICKISEIERAPI